MKTNKSKFAFLAMLITMTFGAMTLTACDSHEDNMKESWEDAKDSMGDAADSVGDSIEEGGDAVKEKYNDATN